VVVQNFIGAQGTHGFHTFFCSCVYNFCSHTICELHGEAAEAAARADNKDRLLAFIPARSNDICQAVTATTAGGCLFKVEGRGFSIRSGGNMTLSAFIATYEISRCWSLSSELLTSW
jgi:hypothetical protein